MAMLWSYQIGLLIILSLESLYPSLQLLDPGTAWYCPSCWHFSRLFFLCSYITIVPIKYLISWCFLQMMIFHSLPSIFIYPLIPLFMNASAFSPQHHVWKASTHLLSLIPLLIWSPYLIWFTSVYSQGPHKRLNNIFFNYDAF